MKANWFIGLPVEPGRWLAPLLREVPYKVRAFHPLDLHITVAFLGPVEQQQAQRAWQVVATNAATNAAMTALTVSLGPVAPMGNPRRPSALSVLLETGRQAVADRIAELRDPMCRAAGACLDTRPPKPHFTIARPTRSASAAQRRQAIAWAAGLAVPQVRLVLNRIALYTWAVDRRERQFAIVRQHQWSETA